MSYDEVMQLGWFIVELRKADAGDKKAFLPDERDVFAFYQTHPEQLAP